MSAILLLFAVLAAAQIKTGSSCERAGDILFIDDSSASICGNSSEPCDAWRHNNQFMANLSDRFTIGPLATRVAVMTYGNTAKAVWDLRGYTNKASLLSAIEKLKFLGGEFNDILSASDVLVRVFDPAFGDNPFRLNLAFVITDGMPVYDEWMTGNMSALLQVAGVKFIVVCVRPGCSDQCAKGIASPPKAPNVQTTFFVDGYDKLHTIVDLVFEQICALLEAYNSPLIGTLLGL